MPAEPDGNLPPWVPGEAVHGDVCYWKSCWVLLATVHCRNQALEKLHQWQEPLLEKPMGVTLHTRAR